MRAVLYILTMVLLLGALSLTTPPSFAVEISNGKQLDFRTGYRGHTFAYHYKWLSRNGEEQTMSFELKKHMAQTSNREFQKFDLKEEQRYITEVMRLYRPLSHRIKVHVTPRERAYEIRFSGHATQPEIDAERRAVEDYMKKAELKYSTERLYTIDKRWGRLPDYMAIANLYAPRVRPVAEAIEKNTQGMSPRQKINYALEFLQSIPYDTLKNRENSNGSGYATPVELLSRNIADCDSKSVALLSILRNMFPQTPMVMVIVPGHAFVGVATAMQPGDVNIQLNGQNYVLAEPVGPALQPLGEIEGRSLQSLQKKDFTYMTF